MSNIIEFLNKTFDIKNDVSVPILISLIVFITGGIINYLIRSINKYFAKLRLRTSFRIMLKEIINQCELKSNLVKQFFPTLTEKNDGDWSMKIIKVTYIETAFKQDFSSLYNSFNYIFRCCCYKKLRLKSFNKIWSVIENLQFIENRIINDFDKLNKQYNEYENKYNSHLEDLRKHIDNLFQPLIGKPIPMEPKNPNDYLKKLDGIVSKWQNSNNLLSNYNRYYTLLTPIHELNKNSQDVQLILPLNNIIMPAMYEYAQMTKILNINYRLFYNYYINYRKSKRVLNKCLKILK